MNTIILLGLFQEFFITAQIFEDIIQTWAEPGMPEYTTSTLSSAEAYMKFLVRERERARSDGKS
jgi:hypothetical protein